MKKTLKGYLAGFITCFLIFGGTLALFANQTETRNITFGVGVMLHGETVQFNYDDRPFVMGGRTFLPIRALAELLDLPVDFDPTTNTAILGRATARAGTPVSELFFDGTSDSVNVAGSFGPSPSHRVEINNEITMGGSSFVDVITFNSQDNSQLGSANSLITQSAMLNLNGRYNWFDGNFGRVDGTAAIDATINIFVDERLVESFEQSAQSLPRDFRLFVEGARSIRVEVITVVNTRQTMTYALSGFAE